MHVQVKWAVTVGACAAALSVAALPQPHPAASTRATSAAAVAQSFGCQLIDTPHRGTAGAEQVACDLNGRTVYVAVFADPQAGAAAVAQAAAALSTATWYVEGNGWVADYPYDAVIGEQIARTIAGRTGATVKIAG